MGEGRIARLALAGLALLALAGSSCDLASLRSSDSTPPLSLTLPKLGGGEVSLSSLRGRPVLLTFFATWSLLTDYELDQVMQAAQAFDGQVALLAVGVDANLVPQYIAATGLSLPVALLPPDVRDGDSPLGPVNQIPRTLVLDASGRVRDDRIGKVPADVLVRDLRHALE